MRHVLILPPLPPGAPQVGLLAGEATTAQARAPDCGERTGAGGDNSYSGRLIQELQGTMVAVLDDDEEGDEEDKWERFKNHMSLAQVLVATFMHSSAISEC